MSRTRCKKPNNQPKGIKSTTGLRCSFCRLHREKCPGEPDWPCLCSDEERDGQTESEIFAKLGTPTPARTRRRSAQAPVRDRQPSHTSEADDALPSSPLQRRSTHAEATLGASTGRLSPRNSRDRDDYLTVTAENEADNILVLNSPRQTPEPASPQSHRRSSSTSTQIVPETPILPRGGPCGRAPAATPPYQYLISRMDYDELIQSRRQARRDLETRTAQINRLITRNQVLEAEKIANQAATVQAQIDLVQARIDAVEAEQRNMKMQWRFGGFLAALVFLLLLYVIWCLMNGASFAYAERRRRVLLGL